ncbi:putative ferric-chelate reductase 1 isoform X2 [Oncorhynchus tshawytscha]|uniref:putative ferric-chelate reductase 1 isoform X2 n=1 Tax=Oncorhynchus tshawytscha TaxID=74940 RepID=UPI000D0A8383|nr:putative ferric-chelate reductase 1 isoform X2 [Oncorhynchus tshawytscha]
MDRYILIIACVLRVVRCYSSGEVTEACDDMAPQHFVTAQQSPAPFSVTADRSSFKEGDEITVWLLADSTPFIGFMLQARAVNGSSPLGVFTVTGGEAQLLTCNGQPSAVSHTSASAKLSIQGTWRAPTSYGFNSIQFSASFVIDFSTFWVGVTSYPVTFSGTAATPANSTSIPITSTTSASSTAVFPSQSSLSISSAGCGSSKVCFRQPLNCDPGVSPDCYFLSAMTSIRDTAIHLEMTGPSDGYIAIGFSDDQMMGNDDIFICGRDSNGIIQLQHAYSTGRRRPDIVPLGNVSDVKSSMKDDIISCSFTTRNPISIPRSVRSSSPYYLMFAHGPTSNGEIGHHTSTFLSDTKMDISRPQGITNATQPPIIKAHGALMLIAWMTTGSLGMITARYLKDRANIPPHWPHVWFLVHVFLMTLTVAATIIAFILSFTQVGGWSGGAHPVLGWVVMILAFFQPIVAMFRCGPHNRWRVLFNWSHALNAVAIKVLAVVAIFTGLSLIDSSEDKWLLKVMGGFVGWEATLYILLDVHMRCKCSDNEEGASESACKALLLLVLFFLGNMAFLVALLVGIAMS